MINNKKLKLAAPLGFFLKLIFGAISFGSALKYVMPTYWSYAVNTDPFVKFGFYLSVAAIIGYNYLLPLYEKNGTPQQIKSVIYLLRFLLLFGATATAYGISQTKLNDADYVANEGKKGNTNYVKNAAKKGLETKKKTPPSLHILIEKGLLHTIADRIKSANSIELNALDSLGRTPLGLAVAMGDLTTTIALLSNKNTDLLKPTFFTPKSVTGKALSILSEKKEFIKTPLNIASYEGDAEIFKTLKNSLEKGGAKISFLKDSQNQFDVRKKTNSYKAWAIWIGKAILIVCAITLSIFTIYQFTVFLKIAQVVATSKLVGYVFGVIFIGSIAIGSVYGFYRLYCWKYEIQPKQALKVKEKLYNIAKNSKESVFKLIKT